MDIIERKLLHRIITDQPFAEYITQRIDIGDFDDETANKIYNGIVDLLCQGRQVPYEVLVEYFTEDNRVIEVLSEISNQADHEKASLHYQ